jgi:hypothetical protein
VCGRAEGVSYDQKGVVSLWIFGDAFEEMVDLYFAEIAVGFDEWDLEEGGEVGVAGAHD